MVIKIANFDKFDKLADYAKVALLEADLYGSLSQGSNCMSPQHVQLPDKVESTIVELNKMSISDPESSYMQAVTLAHCHLLQGDYSTTIKILEPLGIKLEPTKARGKYIQVILIKRVALLGGAYDSSNQLDRAARTYNSASDAYNYHTTIRECPEGFLWAERAYYRFGWLSARLEPKNTALSLNAIRGYTEVLELGKLKRPGQDRLKLLRVQLECMSKLLYEDKSNPMTVRDCQRLSDVYEQLLFEGTKFPRSDESNASIEQFVDLLACNWQVIVNLLPNQLQVIDNNVQLSYTHKILTTLRKAAVITFQSCVIIRHHVTVLTSLGFYDEAIMAFETYRSYQKRIKELQASGSLASEGDDDVKIIEIYSLAIRLIVVIKKDSDRAKKYSDDLQSWLPWLTSDAVEEPSELNAETRRIAYSSVGYSYWLLAEICRGEDSYTQATKMALSSFDKSINFGSRQLEDFVNYAIMLARDSEISKAMDIVRKCLLLDNLYIPAWHVMSLLLSVQEEYQTAIKVINSAMSSVVDIADSSLRKGSRKLLLQLKMTQIALIEATDDTKGALDMLPELFALFSELYPSEGVEQENNELTTVKSKRSALSSRPIANGTTKEKRSLQQ